MTRPETLLEVRDLWLEHAPRAASGAPFAGVRGVSFDLRRGEVLAVVGESGSGKSSLARAVLGLEPAARGQVWWHSERAGRVDLLALDEARRRPLRPELGVVFQDPGSSLNPRQTILEALCEPLRVHRDLRRDEREGRALEWLERVGLTRQHAARRPHALSGGERQRAALARALVLEPRLLVCDEVLSALDVSSAAVVVDLLASWAREFSLALLFIAHDLAVVRNLSHRVGVLFAGQWVELGPTEAVFERPAHPTTRALLAARTPLEPLAEGARAARTALEDVAALARAPARAGCAFHPRCAWAREHCRQETPRLSTRGPGHEAACFESELR